MTNCSCRTSLRAISLCVYICHLRTQQTNKMPFDLIASNFEIWGGGEDQLDVCCVRMWLRRCKKRGNLVRKQQFWQFFGGEKKTRKKHKKIGRESFFMIGNSRIFQKSANYTNIWRRSDKFLGLKYTQVHASINKYGWFWSDSRIGLQCLTPAGIRSRKCAWIRSDLMNGLCN